MEECTFLLKKKKKNCKSSHEMYTKTLEDLKFMAKSIMVFEAEVSS